MDKGEIIRIDERNYSITEAALISELTDKFEVYDCDIEEIGDTVYITFSDIEYKLSKDFFNKHFKIERKKHGQQQ